MNETQLPMGMDKGNVIYWLKNQVAFTFHSSLHISEGKDVIIESLQLDQLNKFLNDPPNGKSSPLSLKSFDEKDVPRPQSLKESDRTFVDDRLEMLGKGMKEVGQLVERLGEKIEELGESILAHLEKDKDGRRNGDEGDEQGSDVDRREKNDLNSPVGKYLFPASGHSGTIVITFFHIESIKKINPADDKDHTVELVNLINSTKVIPTTSRKGMTAPAAMPNWLSGGCGDTTHGCPTSPPMPVPADSFCTSSPGYWPIHLPELSDPIQQNKGDGVTVFVLDTIPTPERIMNASGAANPPNGGAKNLLLQKMAMGMKSSAPFDAAPPAINVNHQMLSIDLESSNAPATGRDLYQKLIGFDIQDHGLFIAGLIRDLAPNAKIECIRVLNDFGVGTISLLTQALEAIQGRMMQGDLQETPVVINLSLVISPEDDVVSQYGLNLGGPDELQPDGSQTDDNLRVGLHEVIKSLTTSGAVIVAAAGNDSHTPEMPDRRGPRYPDDFSEVVSVAAVIGDQNQTEASYSNRATSSEQPNGIATYGGNVAKPVAPASSGTPLPPVAPHPLEC